MERTVSVSGVPEALLELFKANGVDYIFRTPCGSIPLYDVYLKKKAMGKKGTLEILNNLQEVLSASTAMGYFMVTGRPQVVYVYSILGIQLVSAYANNAQQGQLGMVICSSRTRGSAPNGQYYGGWGQGSDHVDQAGPLRGYVKWEGELRSADSLEYVVQRALQIAGSQPCGPVYLSIPDDVLDEKLEKLRIPDVSQYAPIAPPQADPALLERVAGMLVQADNPLIVTAYSGRNPRAVTSLVELAEALSARVVTYQYRMNFPTEHPLCGGFVADPYLSDADAILVMDYSRNPPFVVDKGKLKPGVKVIYMDNDPLKEYIPLWLFPADIAMQADSGEAMPLLTRMVRQKMTPERKASSQARFKRLKAENEKMRDEWKRSAKSKAGLKPISPEWVAYCVGEAIDDETIVLAEPAPIGLRQIPRSKPGTCFYRFGPALGWSLGSALGAKLAAPDKTVVTMVGDGAFNFGPSPAALWASNAYQAPFLVVIFNNLGMHAGRTMKIEPPINYTLMSQSCGGYGEKVEDPSELPLAIKRALEQVRGGKPALLDVRIDPGASVAGFDV